MDKQGRECVKCGHQGFVDGYCYAAESDRVFAVRYYEAGNRLGFICPICGHEAHRAALDTPNGENHVKQVQTVVE